MYMCCTWKMSCSVASLICSLVFLGVLLKNCCVLISSSHGVGWDGKSAEGSHSRARDLPWWRWSWWCWSEDEEDRMMMMRMRWCKQLCWTEENPLCNPGTYIRNIFGGNKEKGALTSSISSRDENELISIKFTMSNRNQISSGSGSFVLRNPHAFFSNWLSYGS